MKRQIPSRHPVILALRGEVDRVLSQHWPAPSSSRIRDCEAIKAQVSIKNGVAVDTLHRFAPRVKTRAKVGGHFGVLNPIETRSAKGGAGKEMRKLKEREVVVGENVEGVAQ